MKLESILFEQEGIEFEEISEVLGDSNLLPFLKNAYKNKKFKKGQLSKPMYDNLVRAGALDVLVELGLMTEYGTLTKTGVEFLEWKFDSGERSRAELSRDRRAHSRKYYETGEKNKNHSDLLKVEDMPQNASPLEALAVLKQYPKMLYMVEYMAHVLGYTLSGRTKKYSLTQLKRNKRNMYEAMKELGYIDQRGEITKDGSDLAKEFVRLAVDPKTQKTDLSKIPSYGEKKPSKPFGRSNVNQDKISTKTDKYF